MTHNNKQLSSVINTFIEFMRFRGEQENGRRVPYEKVNININRQTIFVYKLKLKRSESLKAADSSDVGVVDGGVGVVTVACALCGCGCLNNREILKKNEMGIHAI